MEETRIGTSVREERRARREEREGWREVGGRREEVGLDMEKGVGGR